MKTPQRFVGLFRGINVGRAKRLAMADLRALLQSLGYGGVRTLLNSGNAVFDAPTAATAASHAQRIRAAVAEQLGVDALLIVKPAADIAAAVAGNPLAGLGLNPSSLLVALTQDAASLQALGGLAGGDWGEEALLIGAHAAYLHCPMGLMESRLALALLRELAESGTTRNWATLEKINALLVEL